MSVPPASAQNQGKRALKAQQKVEKEAEKRQELLEEVQPMADRFAEAMVTRKYSDSLVQGYVSSHHDSDMLGGCRAYLIQIV